MADSSVSNDERRGRRAAPAFDDDGFAAFRRAAAAAALSALSCAARARPCCPRRTAEMFVAACACSRAMLSSAARMAWASRVLSSELRPPQLVSAA